MTCVTLGRRTTDDLWIDGLSSAAHSARLVDDDSERLRHPSTARDRANQQVTVWPWLLGPLVDVLIATGDLISTARVVNEAGPHLWEWGLGSVPEPTVGGAPHNATGYPFRAWSVAERLRPHRLVDAEGC